MAIVNNLVMQLDGQNITVYPYTVGRAVYINESNGYNLIQALEDLRSNAISEWVNIRNKPFSDLGSDFKVVDGHLQLNVNVTSDWDNIQNKPTYFNTTWSKITGIPESFPCGWDDISNKPSYYQADWDHITNRPENFASTWNDIEGKPEEFPTEWNLVANRPEDFASTWEDIKNKPFEELDDNSFVVEDNILRVIYPEFPQTFKFIEQSTYNTLQDQINYYVVCNANFNDKGSKLVSDSYTLPYLNHIRTIKYSSSFEALGGGSELPVYNNGVKYNFISNIMCESNNNYYYNVICDYLFANANFNDFTSDMAICSSRVPKFDKMASGVSLFQNARFRITDENVNFYLLKSYKYPNGITVYTNNLYRYMFDNAFIYADSSYRRLNLRVEDSGFNTNNMFFLDNLSIYNYLDIDNQPSPLTIILDCSNRKVIGAYPNLFFNYINGTAATIKINNFNLSDYYHTSITLNNTKLNCLMIENCDGSSSYDQYGFNIRVYGSTYINTLWFERMDTLRVILNRGGIKEYRFNAINYLKLNSDSEVAAPLPVGGNIYFNFKYINNRLWFNRNADSYYRDNNVFISWSYINASNINLANAFRYGNLNNVRFLNSTLYGQYQYPNLRTLVLNNTFAHCQYQSGILDSSGLINNRYGYIYCDNTYRNAQFIKYGKIIDNMIECNYIFAECPNLINAILPNSKNSQTKNLSYGWFNCPSLSSISGGGYYDTTNEEIIALNNIISLDYAFWNSNILSPVEFNLYICKPFNLNNFMGGTASSYTTEKKIHILAGSDLDSKSLTEPYFIVNNAELNAENITILSNGRFFNDYNLYIYNDIESILSYVKSLYGNIDSTNDIYNRYLNDIIFINDNTLIDESDPNIINLGAWSTSNMDSYGVSYLNNESNIIYVTYNNQKKTLFANEYVLYPNTKNYSYLSTVFPSIEATSYNIIFENSIIEKTLNYFDYWNNLNANYNPIFNIAYKNCNYLTDIDVYDGNRQKNFENAFYGCTNLEYININIDNIYIGDSFNNMFKNCFNLKESLVLNKIIGGGTGNCHNMYQNCYNLIDGYVGPSFLGFTGMFQNCVNMENVLIDFSDENAFALVRGGIGTTYEMFNRCFKLQRVKLAVPENYQPQYDIEFNSYYIFNGCKSLVYMPMFPFNYNARSNIWCFNNCDNIVVAQIGNASDRDHGYPSTQQEINNSYYGPNCVYNFAIASLGNGYNHRSGFYNELPNLIMAATAETYSPYPYFDVYNAFNGCTRLVYGRIISFNNISGNIYGYNNCYNLLIQECSEDKDKELTKALRNDTLRFIDYYHKYNWCNNLVSVKIPMATSIRESFNNCSNLFMAQITMSNNSLNKGREIYYSFQEDYNLKYVYVNGSVNVIYMSFNNCYNLEKIDGFNVNCGNIQYTCNNCHHLNDANVLFIQPYYPPKNIWCSFNFCGFANNIYLTGENLPQMNCVSSFGNLNYAKEVVINCNSYNIYDSFINCHNLTDVYLGDGANNRFMDNVTYSFRDCWNLKNITLDSLTNSTRACYSVFSECPNVQTLTLIGNAWDTIALKVPLLKSDFLYNSLNNLTTIKFINNIYLPSGWVSQCEYDTFNNLTTLDFDENCTLTLGWNQGCFGNFAFANMHNIRYINVPICYVNSFIPSICDNCSSLIEPIINFNNNGDSIINMSRAYANCNNLLNAVCFNNTIDMYMAYCNCYSLIDSVCGSNVANLAYTYLNCTNLVYVNIGPNVVNSYYAFVGCVNLANNVSINSTVLNWMPTFNYRDTVDFKIHIYQDSKLYNELKNTVEGQGSISYHSIYSNPPELDGEHYSAYPLLDEPNRRFYWEQPNVLLNIYYDLE